MTGFEPFRGSDVNPSGEAASALDCMRVKGIEVVGVVLEVSWERALPELRGAIEDAAPEAVLCLGQSGRGAISLERIAINRSEGIDNRGVRRQGEPVIAGGPDGLFCQMSLRSLRRVLLDEGIPAETSNSAGTYLCNFVMYGLLHHLRESEMGEIPAGFVHIPSLPRQAAGSRRPIPSMSQDMINEAVLAILDSLV